MVVNYGLQSKEEQMLEKFEVSSVRSENPARIEDIFDWIDGIPLSKTTKNLARDFSDAVLMAEILKFYYPNLVNSHNYIPANSVQNKKENWITLNRKVLCKIDMRLSPETIDQLAHSQAGVIEKVLVDFRDKQMSVNIKEINDNEIMENPSTKAEFTLEQPRKKSIFAKICSAFNKFFKGLWAAIIAIVCFWRWFSKKSSPHIVKTDLKTFDEHQEQLHKEVENQQLRDSYSTALKELQVKTDFIKTLCHKVAFLEGSMKLKDMKIASLVNQLEQQNLSVDGTQSARPGLTASNLPKIRKRPRTQV